MITARDRFLSSGVYEPIAEAVAGVVAAPVIVEVGAGTGYYLAQVLSLHPDSRGVATDVSAAAAKRAARAHDRQAAIVADTWAGTPIRDGVVDTVLCIFAPRNLTDFRRMLKPGGRFIAVTPLPDHLIQLRNRFGLLDVHEDKQNRLATAAEGLFTVQHHSDVRYDVTLSAEGVMDVINMGPNAFHSGKTEISPDSATVTVSVDVTVFEPI